MTTKKIICLDCNKFIFDIEETPEHIHHNIHSEKTLYNHLINDDTINDRLVNLIEDMKNCVEAVNHIDSQINTIKVTFESIHNRLMVEEHALKKPLEEQLETIKESMKKMYDEIIHYWNLNQWINQNNSNSSEESISLKSSSDTSVSIQVVENEESNINNNSSSDESATTTPDTSIDFEKEQVLNRDINNIDLYSTRDKNKQWICL